MRTSWLLISLLGVLGNVDAATAQVADIAGVLPGDRWVYEVTDEVTGDIKQTTTVVVLDVSEKEINTRMSIRGAKPATDCFRSRLEPRRRQPLEVHTVRWNWHQNAAPGRPGLALR